MAQQEGPFSSYLDYMQKPIAPAPTGLEGTGMGIANIAMNFLQGLRQGRAQKYMQKEAEENRKEQLLLNAMQTIQKSDMLPEDKAQYEARIQQEFAKRVAGVKEGSKDTGNPLTDFFKRAGMSLVGGQPPGGKKADIDMNVALEAFAAASDPSRSKTRFIADLDRQADELIRSGMQEAASKGTAASYETFFSGDRGAQLNALIDKARRLGAPLPAVEKTRSEYRPLTQDEITKQKRYEQAQGIKSKIQTEGYQPNLLDLEILHAADGLRHPVSKEGMFLTKEGEHVRGFVTQSPYVNQGRPLVLGENNQPLDYVRQVGAAERISPAELERVSAKPIQYIMNIPGIPAEQLKDYANRVKAAVSIGGPQASQDVARAHADAVKFAADYRERVAKEKAAEVAANKRLSEEQRDRLEGIFKSITSDDKYKWKNIYDNIAAPALQRASRRPSSLTEQAADDILLIRAIAKLTDITTGVREGEYNTFADVNSKYANFVQGIQNVIGEDGQAREILTAPARAAYVNKLKELNDNASNMYNALLNKAENQAREFKIDPGAIRRVFTLGDISQYTPTTSTPPGGESVVGRGAVVSPRSPVVKQPNPFRK